MRIVRDTDPDFITALKQLQRRFTPATNVEKTVAEIIADVRARGDVALAEWTEKFGGPRLAPDQLCVSADELRAAVKNVDRRTTGAILFARENVLDFSKRGLRKNWTARNRQGALVGERFDPFERVGIYVPGGTAPLVSTAVMTCTLAKAAGVAEIVVTTPASSDGTINSALLAALKLCGATEIYKMGGAQAIAALAYGTATVKPVLKLFGPGNAYVVEAKRQVFGQVAIDLLPGPSEILIIADATANAAWIAADLLAQAEHGEGSAIVFVTTSAKVIDAVKTELENQVQQLSRQEHARAVLQHNTFLVLVKSMAEAIRIANDFAPEHLAVIARSEEEIAARIRTAGAIFLGPMSPVVAGDFVAGPSHELPTGGAGKSFSGLTADQFQRRTSIVRFTGESLKKSLPIIKTFSEIEGLDAHGRSAATRFSS